MLANLAANAVLVVHALFIVWVVLGGFAVVRRPRAAWLHLPALAWGVWIIASHGICPLTPLENRLRLAADGQGYSGGFLEHYVAAVIYPKGLTEVHQTVLAIVLVALNLVLYGWALHRHQRRSRR